MAHAKRSYAATETVVKWVLGTKPGGMYLPRDPKATDLTPDRDDARFFPSDRAAM